MTNNQRILVTGFSSFLGESINPSENLVQDLQSKYPPHLVDFCILPVVFSEAVAALSQKMRSAEYSAILMLGQAGGREMVCFERVALNWLEAEYPDESGFSPRQGKINETDPSALLTELPITSWVKDLKALGIKAQVSLSAGGYVCNYLYFHALCLLKSLQRPAVAVFVHVPYLPEQVQGKPPGTPSMSLEEMGRALKFVLDNLLNSKIN